MTNAPLRGLSVLELSTDIGAARWCGRVMADLGASVDLGLVGLTPDDPATDSGLDPDNRGKRARHLPGDLSAAIHAAAADYDVLLIDQPACAGSGLPDSAALEALADRGTVIGVFSPCGLDEAQPGGPDTEFTVQAASGIMSTNGYPSDPPLAAGVPVGRTASALNGLTAVLAAVVARWRAGRGDVVDVAAYDSCVGLMGTLLPTVFLTGHAPARLGNRHPMTAPWNVYPASDGWVALTTIGQAMWVRCAQMIRRDELAADPRFATAESRMANVEDLDAIITDWTMARTVANVMADASAHEIPASSVYSLSQAMSHPALVGRDVLRSDYGRAYPGAPVRFVPRGDRAAAGPLQARPASVPRGAPLTDLRVLEIGSLTSAPLAGRLLAMLGADVLKIEPAGGELSRHLAAQVAGTGYLYFMNNTDKRGCVLDIRSRSDSEKLSELLTSCDVLLTNLAPATLERSGLGYQAAAARNPDLIYGSVSAFGLAGTASEKAFDMGIQAVTGVMDLTGAPGGHPLKIGISFADLMGACAVAAGVLAAVVGSMSTRSGWLVDVSMFDVTLWSTHELWGEMPGTRVAPLRPATAAPGRLRAVLACRDGHIAIDAPPDMAAVTRSVVESLAVDLDRRGAEGGSPDRGWLDELEELTRNLLLDDLVAALRASGVPAAPVLDLAQLVSCGHVRSRQLIIEQSPDDDTHVRVIGPPVKFARAQVGVRHPAPRLGAGQPEWRAPGLFTRLSDDQRSG